MGLALVRDETDSRLATFDSFWTLFPKRVARKDAIRAWAKLSDADHVAALVGLVEWRKVWMARGDVQFVPNAATWLNGERWTDELPAVFSSTTHASHVAAVTQDAPVRSGGIPAHVQAVIDRLKAKQ